MSFLEQCWEHREEHVYKEIFTDTGPGIYTLPAELFETRFNIDQVDPRWLTYGVFKCPPTSDRTTWAYVSSGMSNPWKAKAAEDYSGLGTEFIMETEQECAWALPIMQTLVGYNILLAEGKMGDIAPLHYGHMVPLALSEKIPAMLIVQPNNFPTSFQLPSGQVDLLQVVGITAAELEAAKSSSSKQIAQQILTQTGGFLTDPNRASVV
ncbi:MAG: suppressor of fused domain protein [Pseudomonadales bacterium]|nr:suppressor of fused domain protein [Pseudomonadales bacterium]NRA16904.1 suppressor of fused domain protein [Oceanospirillaceae bacterium]